MDSFRPCDSNVLQVALLKYEVEFGPDAIQHGVLTSYDATTGCHKFLKAVGSRKPVDVHLALNFVVDGLQLHGNAPVQESQLQPFRGLVTYKHGEWLRQTFHEECSPSGSCVRLSVLDACMF